MGSCCNSALTVKTGTPIRRSSVLQSSLWSLVTLTKRFENLSTSLFSSASVAVLRSASAFVRFSFRFASYRTGRGSVDRSRSQRHPVHFVWISNRGRFLTSNPQTSQNRSIQFVIFGRLKGRRRAYKEE